LTDRLAVSVALPYILTKYYGTPGQNFFPHTISADDGHYHGIFQDFRFDLDYQLLRGPVAVAPFFAAVIPIHSYTYFAHAAGGFARVVLLAPDSPLGEDAGFWRAVALARARRSLEAVAAFHDFLDGYPHSSRAGEASAMLGWLLIDARVFDEAGRRFQAADGDPDPAVRRSARSGLDALAGRTR